MPGISMALATEFELKINGEKAPQDLARMVYTIEVEKNLHLPDVFAVRFHIGSVDEKPFSVVDDYMKNFLSDGVEVEIHQYPNRNNKPPIVVGEITSLELDLSSLVPGSATSAVIRGYDRSHRLHRGRHTGTFSDMSYGDIVNKVARDAGLSTDVDSAPPGPNYVLQCNQTDWDFLWQLARRVGFELYIDGKTLCFKEPWKGRGGGKIDLEWGASLIQFRMIGSTVFQASDVEVRGWDPIEKTTIIGKATSGDGFPSLKDSRTGIEQARKAFGESKLTVVDMPVYTQSEADAMAKSLADAMASDFITAEGVTAEGMPEILPGVTLNITGLGSRLSGEYYVTSVSHTFSHEEGYTTSFGVSGRRPDTLLSLIESDHGLVHSSGGGGMVVGVVTNNNDDEENLSRVKVKYPCLGEEIESDWIRVVALGGGKNRGIHWLPEVNDEVLIAFEYGDVHRPYILGGLWSKPDSPPVDNSKVVGSSGADRGKVTQRTIQSRSGHLIILDDSDGAEKIIIRDKTGVNEIILDSAENSLIINVDKDVTMHAAQKITVTADQGLEFKTGSSAIRIEQSGNIEIDAASGQVNVKGSRINLN